MLTSVRGRGAASRIGRVAVAACAPALIGVVATPAYAGTPQGPVPSQPAGSERAHAGAAPSSSVPSAGAAHLPVTVDLGGLHISLDVPLDLGGLLGGRSTSAPPPSTSPVPSRPVRTRSPVSRPVVPVTTAPRGRTSRPTRTVTTPTRAATSVQAADDLTSAPRHRTSTPTHRPPARHAPVEAVQQILHPSSPVLVLLLVVVLCGIGTGVVVLAGGRRRLRPTRTTGSS